MITHYRIETYIVYSPGVFRKTKEKRDIIIDSLYLAQG